MQVSLERKQQISLERMRISLEQEPYACQHVVDLVGGQHVVDLVGGQHVVDLKRIRLLIAAASKVDLPTRHRVQEA